MEGQVMMNNMTEESNEFLDDDILEIILGYETSANLFENAYPLTNDKQASNDVNIEAYLGSEVFDYHENPIEQKNIVTNFGQYIDDPMLLPIVNTTVVKRRRDEVMDDDQTTLPSSPAAIHDELYRDHTMPPSPVPYKGPANIPSPPPSVQSFSSRVSLSSKSSSNSSCCGQMSLDMFIDFTDGLSNLQLNRRRERDWSAAQKKMVKAYDWASTYLKSAAIFKQKAKLVLQERRGRHQLNFFSNVMKSCQSKEDVAEVIRSRTSDPMFDSWDLTPVSSHLWERYESRSSGPGSLIEWSEGPRNAFVDMLLAVHNATNGSYVQPYERFKSIFVLSEIEMAILCHCSCETCKPWNLAEYKDDICMLRFEWTKKRGLLMKNLLELHKDCGKYNNEDFFACVDSTKGLEMLKNWSHQDIRTLIAGAHSERNCSICCNFKRQKRGTTIITQHINHLSFDNAEAEVHQMEDECTNELLDRFSALGVISE